MSGSTPSAAVTLQAAAGLPTPSTPSGRRVLVPRPRGRSESLAALLRQAGFNPVISPVITRAPPQDTTPLDEAVRRLDPDRYPWAAVTSVAGVEAVASSVERVGTRLNGTASWAVVGPATRRALEAHGGSASLVPGEHSAAGLVRAFRGLAPARILLALGDLAASTLADGLRALGWVPDVVTAYRTLPAPVPEQVREAWLAGTISAVLVTSGSVAREVATQLGPRPDVVGVAIGRPAAEAARAAGLRVDSVAAIATDEALVAALVREFDRH